ncbi:hypothetical protein [Flavobacterium litorale]|uniref:Branched-chain amino acid:cation transporter, LIVCS family n=1 Tax=Flavobacterium litorale TaxID=2856519 RepID=A0ABX8V8N3_9FLAO|nr:hypothetical protein [Flavobacterium litorale]QYJ67573.1 hypothetical protein K1I41_08405 [Flavobacterium litorale]
MEIKEQKLPHHITWIKQIPTWLFGASFVGGTIVFTLYLLNLKSENYIEIGFTYILIAATINSVVFIGLAIASFIHKQYQTIILARATLMLLNIPISILYILIVIYSKQLIF